MKFKITFALLLTIIILASCTNKDDVNQFDEDYKKADAAQGGILYDKFWAQEANYDQTSPNIAKVSAKADFFRCKQCHGWDLMGNTGSYISRGPKTSRPNIAAMNLFTLAKNKTAEEIYDGMVRKTERRSLSYDLTQYDPSTNKTEGDKMPDYTELLTDAEIMNLVKFIKEGAIDVSELYDATYTGTYPTGSSTFSNVGKNGNPANGKTFFAANCAVCHGDNGTTLTMEGMSVGQFTRKKPNEVQHKVKYGQLGSPMVGEFNISLEQMKDLYKALSNETDFPDATVTPN
ncbi:MAG: cytochrome c [Bacteroidetes bacterium]|nr:cytochrome c [Bacteroidota bacterium]NCQ10853.1 cytochrome c [Bacteroidota bacterium]